MEWGRVKTILIIALLAVNVFLFAAYANSALREARDEKQVHSEVCRVVTDLGYVLEEHILPQDSEMYYPARVTRNSKNEQQAMQTALESVEVHSTLGAVEYQGKRGKISIRTGGYVTAELELNHFNDAYKAVQASLRSMHISTSSLDVVADGDAHRVIAVCEAAAKPIYNCRITGALDAQGKLSFNGRVPMGEISFMQNVTPRTVSGLMLNFAQHVQSSGVTGGTIRSITAGYMLMSNAQHMGASAELIPVWRVVLDESEWFINALSGEIVAPE